MNRVFKYLRGKWLIFKFRGIHKDFDKVITLRRNRLVSRENIIMRRSALCDPRDADNYKGDRQTCGTCYYFKEPDICCKYRPEYGGIDPKTLMNKSTFQFVVKTMRCKEWRKA